MPQTDQREIMSFIGKPKGRSMMISNTDGSNDKGVMGAGFFKLDEHRGGCCQLGRGEEGNSFNRAELGAACKALEDSKRQQDRKPIILLTYI